MTTTLLLATKNASKIREFRALFWDVPKLIVKAADEVGILADVAEDGRSFEENASKKAREIALASGHLVLADDSGLEVDALGGRPGVYSARYAGRHGDDEGNNDKLLLELAGTPDEKRSARYRVVIALADPKGPLGADVHLEHGVCEGVILRVRRGHNGFGYDPVFAPKGHDKAMAELSPEEKNSISHRSEAAAKMRKFLGEYLAQRAGGGAVVSVPGNGRGAAVAPAPASAASTGEAAAPKSTAASNAGAAAASKGPAQEAPKREAPKATATAAAPAASKTVAAPERAAANDAAPAPEAAPAKAAKPAAKAKSKSASASRTAEGKPASERREPAAKAAAKAEAGDSNGSEPEKAPARRGKPRVA